MLYTSGSTGKPKGVGSRTARSRGWSSRANFARIDASRVVLQLAPIAFDASTLELWGALLHGAKLVVYPGHARPPRSSAR